MIASGYTYSTDMAMQMLECVMLLGHPEKQLSVLCLLCTCYKHDLYCTCAAMACNYVMRNYGVIVKELHYIYKS